MKQKNYRLIAAGLAIITGAVVIPNRPISIKAKTYTDDRVLLDTYSDFVGKQDYQAVFDLFIEEKGNSNWASFSSDISRGENVGISNVESIEIAGLRHRRDHTRLFRCMPHLSGVPHVDM